MELSPDKRITEIAPAPEGVAKAIMVSLCMFVFKLKSKLKMSLIKVRYNRFYLHANLSFYFEIFSSKN